MSHSLGHGGGERQLALTALSLDRARFQPHVACCEGGFWMDRLRDAGVPIFIVGSRSLLSAKAFAEAARLRRYIRDRGIRILQTFDYSMNVFGIPVGASLAGTVAISNLRCHMDLIPSRYRWLNRLAHRLSRAVVVNSLALRRHLTGDYRIPAQKIFTCYNGIDTNVFHPSLRDNAAPVIGTICVLRQEKNLPLLLEAFSHVSALRPGVRLLIVGSGPEEGSLHALAQTLGIQDACEFRPSTPDVPACLAAMDIFVLPSLTEGLSNAVMEAMASGCCVIASDVGGNPELITDGVTGLLFPSRDRDALIERLLSAIDDPGRRQALALAASQRMRADFSLTRAAECMQSIYETMLSCAS
jgi:glycosyltransferase involved in cell wall biosynthesis